MTGAMREMLREVFEAGWDAALEREDEGPEEAFRRWLAIHDLVGES